MRTDKNPQSISINVLSLETKRLGINTWSQRHKNKKNSKKGQLITVPNMALDIRTILERYSRGQSLPKTRTPVYSEEDYSELEKLDTLDKLDLLQSTKSYIQETRQKQKDPPKTNDKTNDSSATKEPATEGSEQVIKS